MRAIAILEKKMHFLGVGLSWKRTMNMQIYKYMHESSPEKTQQTVIRLKYTWERFTYQNVCQYYDSQMHTVTKSLHVYFIF